MEDAGILGPDQKLTAKAKKRFIDDVLTVIGQGSSALNLPFKCGEDVPATPFAPYLDLENEEKYEVFLSNYLGSYETIAQGFNTKSNFAFLPVPGFCDPIALGFALGASPPKIKFPDILGKLILPPIPDLAVMLNITPPPKLLQKLIALGIPSIPKPPVFNIPTFDPVLRGEQFELFTYGLPAVGLPAMFIKLVGQLPGIIPKLTKPTGIFEFTCEQISNSSIFGSERPESFTKIAAKKVLAQKTSECMGISLLGSTLGSAPAGLTGGMGGFLGYDPPTPDNVAANTPTVRDKIVDVALNTAAGLAFGIDPTPYVEFLFPIEATSKLAAQAKIYSQVASSCGLTLRAIYRDGGFKGQNATQDDQISGQYVSTNKQGHVIEFLATIAKSKSALIDSSSGTPTLQPGDGILVGNTDVANSDVEIAQKTLADWGGTEHVLLITEKRDSDYLGVEGGSTDGKNYNKPTAIVQTRYELFQRNGNLWVRRTEADRIFFERRVRYIFDGEKMVS